MTLRTKIKRIILAGIIALTLLIGSLNVGDRVQASNSSTHLVNKIGTCWKCT